MNLQVGVKFCGHCNPAMDMWRIYKNLLSKTRDGFDVTLLGDGLDVTQQGIAPGDSLDVTQQGDEYGVTSPVETDKGIQYDCFVIMNACRIACASEPQVQKPCIRVEPGAVDGMVADSSCIVDLIVSSIKEKCKVNN